MVGECQIWARGVVILNPLEGEEGRGWLKREGIGWLEREGVG